MYVCVCVSKEFHIKYIILYNMSLFSYDNDCLILSRSLKCYSCSDKSTDSDDLHLIELTLHKDPPSFPL